MAAARSRRPAGPSPASDHPPGPSSGPSSPSPEGSPEAPGGLQHLVAIGSSAGGLEALQELLSCLVDEGSVAYVVAQHLAPEHRSLIVPLLSHVTSLRVVTAVDGRILRPGMVAVAPPKHDVTVEGERLRVIDPTPRFGPSPSADLLFESVAEQWGERGVAVVLSGTGSDGARGLRAVRAAGGLTLVQSPESARFDGMPRAAIGLGGGELVLPAAEIGQRLAALATLGQASDWSGRAVPEPEPVMLQSVSNQLRQAIGIDFSQYKESTLRRQVRRRMAIRQVTEIDDYLALLTAEPEEAHALSQNLLVTVTSFFRDPEAFEALGRELEHQLQSLPLRHRLRVWVPGCATGEEVYSIAMVVSGLLGHPADLASRLKIFGTDLDEISLAIARRAVYPASAAREIPEALCQRFVRPRDEAEIEISDTLRECVVFARHNVTEDPPFPRLDLISCRNTLIYFTAPLRDRVLSLFRFALQVGGLLFLGSSESLGSRTPGFAAAQPEYRLYRRSTEGESVTRLLPALGGSSPRRPIAFGPPGSHRIAILRDSVPEQHMALLEGLLRTLCPPCLILDENHDLVEVLGEVGAYCQMPQGRMTASAHAFLRPELQAPARALSLAVRANGEPVSSAPLLLEGLESAVRLEGRPLVIGDRTLMLLSFLREPLPQAAVEAPRRLEHDSGFDREIERLERELLASQDSLRRSLVELEGANEELEASSEELQASSEELQSSNEELEASNEELQASNEALGILNQQLRSRTDELQQVNTDLENIQASLSQGMVIVDRELRVTRFTPLAVRVFALLDSDLGQPLTAVPTTVPVPGLREALQAVLGGEGRRSIEASGEQVSYLVQVLPYQDQRGQRRGAIVTLTEVSELVRLRRASEEALEDFARLTDALEEVIWKRDVSMQRLLYASQRIQSLTGWTSEELYAQPDLLEEALDPADRERVQGVRAASGAEGWVVRYRFLCRDGRRVWLRETAKRVGGAGLEPGFVVGTLVDVSGLQELEEQARQNSAVFESVFHAYGFGVAILDSQQRVVMANATLCGLVGLDPETIEGVPTSLLAAEGYRQLLAAGIEAVLRGPEITECQTLQLQGGAGGPCWVTAEIRALPEPAGSAVAVLIVQDVTALRETTLRLESQARIDAATGLLNRASFCEALERELARAARDQALLALAWVDLDRFKEVNDQYGHEAGDLVLRTVGERLSGVIRQGKDYVGRLGGDEFGIILTGLEDPHELERILERAMEELLRPIPGVGVELHVGASVGLALHPRDATGFEELLRAADTAMYGAKVNGGNSFRYFRPEMNAAAEERRTLWKSLSRSVEEEAFSFHFQPILTAGQERVWGVEALLRWEQEGEQEPAKSFIDFAEESGLIRQLGPLTLRLLRRDMERLGAGGWGGLPVCLNMTLRQLEDPRLAELLDLWPTPSGMAGIVVEVSESVLLPDHARALATLRTLAGRGARIAVDNYGRGFSNLWQLQGLEPALIKLDPSLLRSPAGLLPSTVALVHALGSLAVVQGVEESEQLPLAAAAGADLQQGYALSMPMTLEELLAWLGDFKG